MSRVLLAWEMGANLGHLARCQAIARGLSAAGIRSLLAARRLGAAEPRAAQPPVLPAPLLTPGRGLVRPPANYAELLLAQGYSKPNAVAACVRAWLDMFEVYGADYVLADYAPTAMLAARLAGLPCAAVGNGFAVPPGVAPWPSIRVFEDIPAARLSEAESALNLAVETALGRIGHRNAPRIRDLFGPNDLLDSFAELDHYGERPDVHYVGPIFGASSPMRIEWKDQPGPRVAAYIRASIPGARALLQALGQSGVQAICVVPDLTPAVARKYVTERLRIALCPVALDVLLLQMDLMIGYGGGATMSEALLAGVPLLLMPHQVEHHLAALRVEELGAARLVGQDRSVAALRDLISQALSDQALRESARRFAHKHQGYRCEQAIGRIVGQISNAIRPARQCGSAPGELAFQ